MPECGRVVAPRPPPPPPPPTHTPVLAPTIRTSMLLMIKVTLLHIVDHTSLCH